MLAGIFFEQPPGLNRIIVFTAKGEAADARRAPEAGASAHHPRDFHAVAQRPTRRVHIGIGIGTAIEQHARNLQPIAHRRIPQRSAPGSAFAHLQFFQHYPVIHIFGLATRPDSVGEGSMCFSPGLSGGEWGE